MDSEATRVSSCSQARKSFTSQLVCFVVVLLTWRPQTFQQHTLDEKQSESLTYCIVLNEQRH